ncbi:hypothetical protein HO133_006189 [Letharia lupina]|uniref:NAD(P)-binding domain-containing protein n=1 Tax=Letharia lupina TaxID=560253 RepID=A0A8H6C7J3_9LECA|nr:uncharacterized protein HO133_006189 [Letharia lupina]KAF6218228.1 hypothetical protein HO133_006189 [Letharia lupina]
MSGHNTNQKPLMFTKTLSLKIKVISLTFHNLLYDYGKGKPLSSGGPHVNVGSATIAALLKECDRFQITALTRPTSSYSPPNDSINVITTDFDSSGSLISTLRNQDALLCCVPGGQARVAAQKLLIDAAIEAGVKLTFASDYVANIYEFTLPDFPDGIRLELGVAGFDIPARRATIYGAGNNLACWTSLPVIPTAVVNMLLHPAAIVNRSILISGVLNPTHNKILAALETETGKELSVEQGDVNQIKSGAMEKLEKGELKAATRELTISAQSNDEEGSADFWDLVEDEAVGVQAVDVREAVSEYLLEQKLK